MSTEITKTYVQSLRHIPGYAHARAAASVNAGGRRDQTERTRRGVAYMSCMAWLGGQCLRVRVQDRRDALPASYLG